MRALAAVLLAALVVTGAAAGAAEPVPLRIGEHAGFSRLVFDWPRPVGVELAQGDGHATLRFDRAGDLDLTRFRADPPLRVSDVAVEPGEGSLTVVLSLARGAKVRLLSSGSSVVLDVLGPEAPPDAPAQRPGEAADTKAAAPPVIVPERKPDRPAEPPAAEVAAPAPVEARGTAGAPAPVVGPIPLLAPARPRAAPEPPKPETKAQAQADAPARASKPEERRTSDARRPPLQPLSRDRASDPGAGKTVSKAPARHPDAAPARPDVPPATALAASGAAGSGPERPDAASAKANAEPAPPASVATDPRPVVIDTAPAPARTLARGAPATLRFDWGAEVGAAAFRRGGALWLVFDRPAPGDLTEEVARLAPELAPVKQFDLPGVTAIRLSAPPLGAPRLRREGSAWLVDLRSYGPRPAPGIELEVDGVGDATQVVFRTQLPGRIVAFEDPDLGDRLLIVPVRAAGQRVPNGHVLTQFRALPSDLGLVLQPLDEGLRVAVDGDAVRVGHDDGLIVSSGASLAMLKANVPSPPKGPRLFDLERWRGDGGFRATKQALQKAVVDSEPADVNVARLALARFYFAHGLAAEALGVLRLRALDDPRLGLEPEARLMTGVCAFLTEDYETAALDLVHPALAGEWEAELWHAALAAVALDWHVAAAQFEETEPLIAAYPRAVRTRLRLLAAEARLGVADAQGAERYLEALRGDHPDPATESRIAVLVGRRLQLEGDVEAAKATWERVQEHSRHGPARVRARLALLDLALEDGTVTPGQAIDELERLRFAWRGDRFEFALLQRLGDLQISLGRYRDGLNSLRQAASYFPLSGRAQAAAQRMREVFVDLYLGDSKDEMPPLAAVALYEEFKELTPPGAKGDAILAGLADRLIDMDLLGRAAELLSSQVKFRLQGASKAQAGAKLAEVRLMDRKPEAALQALEISSAADIDAELARRRRILQARALSELGRHEEALAALGSDDAPKALRLRADILWAAQNWPAAALVLARLVPEQPPADRPLAGDEARAVIRLATALTIAGERDKLTALGKAYGPAFDGLPQRATFALLVGEPKPGAAKSVAQQLAEIDQVEAFMTRYRQRLRDARSGQGN